VTDNSEFGIRNSECKIRKTECKKNIPHSAFGIPHSSGFTLLEVMVAVAILAMVLVSLLAVKNRSTEDVMLEDHITTATLLAKRVITETLATTGQLQETDDQGEFEEDEFKDYIWQKKIAPLKLEAVGAVKIMEVRVAVLWKEGTRQEMVELASYE
jgi:general secretion pathway protein I